MRLCHESVWPRLATLSAAALLLGAADAPEIPAPAAAVRNYTIKGNGLTIRPGTDTTYLRFSGGVTISGAQLKVSADTVEADIASGEIGNNSNFKLPKMDLPQERISQDPGKVAADMARDLKLPQANFSRSSLRRIGAAGNVQFSGNGMQLNTPALVSADGGRSWSAQGRSSIAHAPEAGGKQKTQAYSLAADNLLFDTQTQQAAARGNVAGSFERSGEDPVSVSAQQAELNIKTGELRVSQQLHVGSGALSLDCGSLSANIKGGRLTAAGTAKLTDSKLGVKLQADTVEVDTKTRWVSASGSVGLQDDAHSLSISAGRLEGTLGPQTARAQSSGDKGNGGSLSGALPAGSVLTASGSPVVTYKGSTFSGDSIKVTQAPDKDGKPGKTVVEVEGPQKAKVNLDELPKKTK